MNCKKFFIFKDQIGKSNKQLPLWIRDGLANMEKEKQKKIEKTPKNEEIDDESDDGDNEIEQPEVIVKKTKNETTYPGLVELSDEEKQELQVCGKYCNFFRIIIILGFLKTKLVKLFVTEILLDATNLQMKLIANEVYKKASGIYNH
jgi:hypothetical protein